jgi:hypothetical protein
MDDAKKQLIDRLQKANNILVTVSHDPSVDQLASCIGLTLLLNKQGKHAAAVFSGKVPSTLEFLKPDDTLEKNTDSLRDFIISLDKAKADKLRYKVEEDVVRIFITPYKTSLSADDLQFSEGDFNVDVVVALGVKKQEDLDQAITAHGRILHDATVTSINASSDNGLGSINWHDPHASSLSELVTDLAKALDQGGQLMDEQIATALLTGIISETGRFSNDRTSSQTMSASAILLSAGANQQLVASKLEEKPSATQAAGAPVRGKDAAKADDGELDIDHSAAAPEPAPPEPAPPEPAPPPQPPEPPQEPPQEPPAQKPPEKSSNLTSGARMMTEPPSMGGTLTANSQGEQMDPATDPLSMPQSEPPALFGRKNKEEPDKSSPKPKPKAHKPKKAPSPQPPPTSQPPAGKPDDNKTLTDIEKSVVSPHSATLSELEAARGEVNKALTDSSSGPDKPLEALNAQPMGGELHDSERAQGAQSDAKPPVPSADDDSAADDSDSPPPVPPPIPFQFGDNNSPPPQQ